ncbi:ISL3 family transposase [Rossellomorea vietnamensis]|uniref:ISL3 family transposase n=1 Tax=Rossellomorea vietnamensis TaxID=218284 RepID=A0A6I6UE07_9BACI|nr:ISL3 family transposase [Rossellomorea vietnamensis]QHE61035.1 ISL3 family transposase [Rossellomorea vietnamensis]
MNSNIILPGFEDALVTKMEEVEERLCIYVEMPVTAHKCPVCATFTYKIHDYRIQKIKHLKLFERHTLIFYKRRRYACPCGKKFAEKNPFVKRYQRLSIELNQAVKIRSIKGKTFKETAEVYGTSSSTVVRRFDQLAKETVDEEAKELPKVIAIDEYKGDTKEGKYQLIIANGITKEPIDILPNRYKNTIKHYLRKYGAQVEVVIMDMSQSFKAAVTQALGKPIIVADRFHFVRYIYWALDNVRRRVQSSWHDYDRKKCKKMRHVFYKKSCKLTEDNRWYLQRYLDMSPELKQAYELKELFCHWFDEAKQNGEEKIHQTKNDLYSFYKAIDEAGIPEFQKAAQTLKNWQIEILNSFMYNYSNGFLEGINNLTKVMKRNAFGFRSFTRFRAKILLTHKYKRLGSHIG